MFGTFSVNCKSRKGLKMAYIERFYSSSKCGFPYERILNFAVFFFFLYFTARTKCMPVYRIGP